MKNNLKDYGESVLSKILLNTTSLTVKKRNKMRFSLIYAVIKHYLR